jgi:CRP-like cAMP-binding protein
VTRTDTDDEGAMEMTLMTMPATASARRRPRPAAVDSRQRIAALLSRACRPGALSHDGALALAAEAQVREVPAGGVVFTRQQQATDLWLVVDGRVSLGMHASTGLQRRRSVQSGSWLDLASPLLHGAHLEDAEAQTAVRVCQVPLHAVLRCARHHACVMPALASAMAADMAALIDATRGLMTKDVLARCATWLLDQAPVEEPEEGAPPTLQLQQRKREIAQELGTTAETFSRTLAQLSRSGFVEVQGYSIRLLDVAALRRLADG